MAIFNFDFRKDRLEREKRERLALLGKRFNTLLGDPGRTDNIITESSPLLSAEEFDAQGNPIFTQDPNAVANTRIEQNPIEATGFQSTDMGAIAQSKLIGELVQAGATPQQANALLSQIDQGDTADATRIQNEAVAEATAGRDRTTRESQLRNRREDANVDFRKVRVAVEDLVTTLDKGADNPFAEKAAITQFVKVGDPTSIVSTNEAGAVSASGGIFDRVEGLAEYVFGQGELTDDMRKDMAEYAANLINNRLENLKGKRADFRLLSTELGLDPSKTRDRQSNFKFFELPDSLNRNRKAVTGESDEERLNRLIGTGGRG